MAEIATMECSEIESGGVLSEEEVSSSCSRRGKEVLGDGGPRRHGRQHRDERLARRQDVEGLLLRQVRSQPNDFGLSAGSDGNCQYNCLNASHASFPVCHSMMDRH